MNRAPGGILMTEFLGWPRQLNVSNQTSACSQQWADGAQSRLNHDQSQNAQGSQELPFPKTMSDQQLQLQQDAVQAHASPGMLSSCNADLLHSADSKILLSDLERDRQRTGLSALASNDRKADFAYCRVADSGSLVCDNPLSGPDVCVAVLAAAVCLALAMPLIRLTFCGEACRRQC